MSDVRNTREDFRDLFDELTQRGLTAYGSVIPSEIVHTALGIEVPQVGTKAVFDKLALTELAAIDYVRNVLLGQGKYITSVPSGYRVLLPSENAKQVELYVSSADKKLNRALKLHRNTPKETAGISDQTEVRIALKQQRRKY
jgi:hypothetical protein